MSDRTPTLGEYAELIDWLYERVGDPVPDPVPDHLLPVLQDALNRVALRGLARRMEEIMEKGIYADE